MSNPRTWYVSLQSEVEVAVLDDQVKAVVEPGPTPHMLRAPVRQSPAAAEAVPEESVLVDVVGVGADVGGAVVHPQQVAPLSPEHGLHPGRGDDAICQKN